MGCDVTGTPKPVVRWFKDGIEIKKCASTAPTETKCWWYVTNVKKEASGLYKCTATNVVSIEEKTYEIIVQGKYLTID